MEVVCYAMYFIAGLAFVCLLIGSMIIDKANGL
jgi:hypothetical protein